MSWLVSFIFLSAALYLFERKRTQLDWFQILAVALVPAIISGIKLFVSMLVELPPMVDTTLWLLTYPLIFLLLWKMMGLEMKRAAGYAAALFVFDLLLVYAIAAMVGSA